MATLILSSIGSAYGGPVGGLIGSLVGQQIDRAIIGNGKAREGPRLKELQLQTSSYGSQIPAVFGSMRVAGTVIWSTDLIESRTKNGGGKNRPATINYSYSASFAVALSSHPALRVGRIWADGNLLRGAAGDFKTNTLFRFYAGHQDQTTDPLIASAVGPENCPAFRGIAYAIFENLQLADYGNRIPSLTFELFESDGPVRVTAIAEQISGGVISGNSQEQVLGYAAQGSDVVSALRPLIGTMPVLVRPTGENMELLDWFAPSNIAESDVQLARINGKAVERAGQTRKSENAMLRAVAIRHFDPSRDYQAGTQQSQLGSNGRNVAVIDLPATLTASNAKRLANLGFLQAYRGRDQQSMFRIGTDAETSIGDFVDQGNDRFRIVEIEKFLNFERIEGTAWFDVEPSISGQTDAGTSLPPRDEAIGQTTVILMDLPAMLSADPGSPQVFVAATGSGGGWRSANVSLKDGDNLIDIGGTAPSAVIGNLIDPLLPSSPNLLDRENSPRLRLVNGDQSLPAGTGDPLSAFAPVLWINGEILRYGQAEYLGAAEYRLHNLARGLAGSEHKILLHPSNSKIVLIDQATMKLIDPEWLRTGQILSIEALGTADQFPVSAEALIEGNAVRPLSPVHFSVVSDDAGGLELNWMRRNRIDPGWSDEVDIPMSEEVLAFDVSLSVNGNLLSSWIVAEEKLHLSAAEILALQIPASIEGVFAVSQIGRHARSRAREYHLIF